MQSFTYVIRVAKNLNHLHARSRLRPTKVTLCFPVPALALWARVYFMAYLVLFFTFVCFWLTALLKAVQSTLLTRGLLFLSTRVQPALQGDPRPACHMGVLQARVTAPLAASSVWMNQQCILNRASSSRNTHTVRLCLDWLTKILWPEACRSLTLYFFRNNGSLCPDSWFRRLYSCNYHKQWALTGRAHRYVYLFLPLAPSPLGPLWLSSPIPSHFLLSCINHWSSWH